MAATLVDVCGFLGDFAYSHHFFCQICDPFLAEES
jgi:hypothetical protein